MMVPLASSGMRSSRCKGGVIFRRTAVLMLVVLMTKTFFILVTATDDATTETTSITTMINNRGNTSSTRKESSHGRQQKQQQRRRRLSSNSIPAAADALKGLKIIVQTRDREEYKGWHKFSLEITDDEEQEQHPLLRGLINEQNQRRTSEIHERAKRDNKEESSNTEYTLHTLCRTKTASNELRRLDSGKFEDTFLSYRLKQFMPLGFDYIWNKFILFSQPWNHPLLQTPCEHNSGNNNGSGSSSSSSGSSPSSTSNNDVDR